MPANLWKSLTIQIMALGHSLREAECIAAVIVIDCLVLYTIMGYRFRDAERDRSPVVYSGPETRCMTRAWHGGIVPERVDRDGIFLQCTLNPAGPGGRKVRSVVASIQDITPVFTRSAAMVCW